MARLRRIVVAVSERYPRTFAAVWFGVIGFLTASSMFWAAAMRRGVTAVVLYVLLPAVAAALAGSISGWRLLARGGGMRLRRAAVHGVAISIQAFVIFSLLFVVAYQLTGGRSDGILALFASVLLVGGIATGPVVVLGGLLAALSLRWITRR